MGPTASAQRMAGLGRSWAFSVVRGAGGEPGDLSPWEASASKRMGAVASFQLPVTLVVPPTIRPGSVCAVGGHVSLKCASVPVFACLLGCQNRQVRC